MGGADAGDDPVQSARDVPKDPTTSQDYVLALGYKLGLRRILELRRRAETALGQPQ